MLTVTLQLAMDNLCVDAHHAIQIVISLDQPVAVCGAHESWCWFGSRRDAHRDLGPSRLLIQR